MQDQYISAWFYGVWNGASGMAAAFPGGMDYGRKSGGTGNYARYTVTLEKVVYLSEQIITTVHRILHESYLRNPNTELKTATNLIDQTLMTVLKAQAGATIGGGAGEPTGSVDYVWRAPAGGGEGGSLLTDEERKSGGDVLCIKAAYLVRVRWA